MSAIYYLSPQGDVSREDEIGPDELDSGRCVYVTDEGELFSVVRDELHELSPDMQEFDLDVLVQDAMAGTYDEDEEDMSETEIALLDTFLERAGGDVAQATADLQDYMKALEGVHGTPQDDDTAALDGLADWLAERGESITNDELLAMITAADEAGHDDPVETGYAWYKHGREAVTQAKSDLGLEHRYTSMDDALNAAYAAGELGRQTGTSDDDPLDAAEAQASDLAARKARALKVKPEDRTREHRALLNAPDPDLMAAAMDSFAGELAAKREMKRPHVNELS